MKNSYENVPHGSSVCLLLKNVLFLVQITLCKGQFMVSSLKQYLMDGILRGGNRFMRSLADPAVH